MKNMNLQTDIIRKIYLRFLLPSLFSGLIMSIYSLVDMIVVGQYEGAAGTAALACIAPLWPFFCCLSTLFGNGGAVLFSNANGEGNKKDSRIAFTVSFLLICITSLVVWIAILMFDEQLLRLFGADDALLPLCMRYLKWLKLGIPLWPLGYFLGAFIRNDGSPALVGIATVCGGIFNIFGDVFLTFTCDMGIEGAAIATVIGQAIVFLIQLIHLFSKRNTIALTKVSKFMERGVSVASIGFSSFLCSVGMGIVVMLFNNQIMRCFGGNELAGGKLVYADSDIQLRHRQCGTTYCSRKYGCRKHGAGKTDKLSEKIIQYIGEHFDTVTLGDVAEHFSYHPNYILGYIRKETGKSFSEIVLEQRMERAAALLKGTDLSIEDIAAMLGYSNNSNFYTAFKNYYHLPPREYALQAVSKDL